MKTHKRLYLARWGRTAFWSKHPTPTRWRSAKAFLGVLPRGEGEEPKDDKKENTWRSEMGQRGLCRCKFRPLGPTFLWLTFRIACKKLYEHFEPATTTKTQYAIQSWPNSQQSMVIFQDLELLFSNKTKRIHRVKFVSSKERKEKHLF